MIGCKNDNTKDTQSMDIDNSGDHQRGDRVNRVDNVERDTTMNGIEQRVKGLEVEVGNLKQSVDKHGEKLEKGLVLMTQHDTLLEQVKTSFQDYQQVRDETRANTMRSKSNRKFLIGAIGSGGIVATILKFFNGG